MPRKRGNRMMQLKRQAEAYKVREPRKKGKG